MKIHIGTKINFMIAGLATLAVSASVLAVVTNQGLTDYSSQRQQEAESVRRAVDAINTAAVSLPGVVNKFLTEERERSLYAEDIDELMVRESIWARALAFGTSSSEFKTNVDLIQFGREYPHVFVPSNTGALASAAEKILAQTQELSSSWEGVRQAKAEVFNYLGKKNEGKTAEYLLLLAGNRASEVADSAGRSGGAAIFSAGQQTFLQNGLESWARELKTQDSQGASLLSEVQTAFQDMKAAADQVSAASDGAQMQKAVAFFQETVVGARSAYQKWTEYASQQLAKREARLQKTALGTGEILSELRDLTVPLAKGSAEYFHQTQDALFTRRRMNVYVLAALGAVGLTIAILFMCWAGGFSSQLSRLIRDINKRCDRTALASEEIFNGIKRHTNNIIEQSLVLTRISEGLKSMSQEVNVRTIEHARDNEILSKSPVSYTHLTLPTIYSV